MRWVLHDKYITVFENIKEKDYLLDLGVNVIIILQQIAKYNGRLLYAFILFRITVSGVLFGGGKKTLGSTKAENLSNRTPNKNIYVCCGYTALFWALAAFSVLNPYTVGRNPWTGDQPVATPLPTHGTTQTQNNRTQTYIP
jgi:hypothetical protein